MDFVAIASSYGGAFVGGQIGSDPGFPLLKLLSAKEIISTLASHKDLKEDGVLPIADCELGNLYVADRRDIIHYINYYGGRTTSQRVADTPSEFFARIVVLDD